MGLSQADQYLHYRGPRMRREKGSESLFKKKKIIMAEIFPNLEKETDIQI